MFTLSPDKLDRLYNATLENGGFTYHIINDDYPTSGYSVACYNAREEVIPDVLFSPGSIAGYVWDNLDILTQENVYLGSWYHDGNIYLDCSIIVNDIDQAIAIASDHDQLALYDLGSHQTIDL